MRTVIVTAASATFEPSVLALAGSLRANWPGHPPLVVFDLGMSAVTVQQLQSYGIEVRRVEPFCPHWRMHFTWRGWCLHNLPADRYLWIDAGAAVLRPMPEVLTQIERVGYFCSTNYVAVVGTCPDYTLEKLGVTTAELAGVESINAGIHGLDVTTERGRRIIQTFYEACLDERAMAAERAGQFHDQPVLTILLWKEFGPLLYGDFKTYSGWPSPVESPGQAIWVHRRKIVADDVVKLTGYLDGKQSGKWTPTLPPTRPVPGRLMRARMQIAKWRGRLPEETGPKKAYNGVRDVPK
jgi:hypothetical protein